MDTNFMLVKEEMSSIDDEEVISTLSHQDDLPRWDNKLTKDQKMFLKIPVVTHYSLVHFWLYKFAGMEMIF